MANAATITTGLKGEFQHAIDVIASQEVDIGLAADVCTVAYLPKMVGNHSLLRELGLSAAHFSTADGRPRRPCGGCAGGPGSRARDCGEQPRGGRREEDDLALVHSRDLSVADNLEYTVAWNAAALLTQPSIFCGPFGELLAMRCTGIRNSGHRF
ncbi:hypothetical protein B0H13DRAFT_2476134 [Mycena leptocephala]|nr:hypothetical protein B0H13DRAFT_2476134 [Mycena leptocephala]